jgi:hypothetical protein
MSTCSVIPLDRPSHAYRLSKINRLVFEDMWSDLHGLYRALPYFPNGAYFSINTLPYVFQGVCIDFEIFYYQLLEDQQEKQIAQSRRTTPRV